MLTRRSLLTKVPLGVAGAAIAQNFGGRARAADADSITIAYPVDVPNWDPVSSGQGPSAPMHKSVFDMPHSFRPDLSVGPSISTQTRWLDDRSMVLQLTIRDGVTFHNGDPLTSDDIKFTLQDRPAADKTLMVNSLWGPARIKSIETPDRNTAIFHFATPYASATSLLGSVPAYITPRKYYERVGREGFMENPIGSGPYRLVDYQRNSRIVLEAYDKYWAGPAKIKKVTFQVIREPSVRIAAIQSGQVDFIHNISVREVQRLGALPNLVAALHPINVVVLIHMVNKGIYKDQNLRLAMHHAIDKAALSTAFFGGRAQPLSTWNGEGPAFDPDFKFEYSQQKAKDLLAKSGYSLDNPAKIKFGYVNGSFANDSDIARTIVQMWKQVGIDATLEGIDSAQYFTLSNSDRLEMPVMFAWTNSSGDPELYTGLILDPRKVNSVWRSDDIPPRLDPLLAESNIEKRMAGYRALDRWTVEQGYSLPVLRSTATVVHSKRINYAPFANGWALPYYWSLN